MRVFYELSLCLLNFAYMYVRSQFELILAAYRAESKQSKGTLAALKEVRARGRKRVMLG